MKNLLVIFTLAAAFTVLSVSQLLAGPPTPPPPPLAIPVDGGAAILLLAGAAFGAKNIYDRRRKVKSAEVE